MKVWRFVAAALAATAALQWPTGAQQPVPQYRIQPLTDLTGAPALSLALRKLSTIGTVVHMTAHPDDENNSALALYARHVGARVALVTATRGDGGQNEIGTELFDALGVLRTEELLTAHVSTARSSTSRERSTSDTRSASRRHSRSGAGRRFSETSCATSGRSDPTSSSP